VQFYEENKIDNCSFNFGHTPISGSPSPKKFDLSEGKKAFFPPPANSNIVGENLHSMISQIPFESQKKLENNKNMAPISPEPVKEEKKPIAKMEIEEEAKVEAKPKIRCNCKKSKCLKLYCECLVTGAFCSPDCNCENCANTIANAKNRDRIMNDLMERKPNSFKLSNDLNPEIGCICKRSHCKKKYCKCFANNTLCTANCKCHNCHNLPEEKLKELALKKKKKAQSKKQTFADDSNTEVSPNNEESSGEKPKPSLEHQLTEKPCSPDYNSMVFEMLNPKKTVDSARSKVQ